MITPKQHQLLEKMKANPVLNELLTRLQLEPIPSPEYKHSQAVAARISELHSEFQARSTSTTPRSVFRMDSPSCLGHIFATPAVIEEYLTTLYGQQPWKYPLPTAPF